MICKMKTKTYIFILFIPLFVACGTSKPMQTNQPLTTISHIQPDTCLTDKQLRLYFKFVKDSMKIENKAQKQRDKKEIDSLKIELKKHRSDNTVIKYEIKFDTKRFNDSISTIRQMYSDSLKFAKVAVKQENKTFRTEVRQENKTERAKLNRLTLFVIGLILGMILLILIRFVMKII